MLAGETIAKDKYPSIIELRAKEAQFDRVRGEYVSLYKQHLSGLEDLSSKTRSWKDYNNTSIDNLTGTECAKERGSCTCEGIVKYGVGDSWVEKKVSGTISCSNDVFGDPAYTYSKKCICIPTGYNPQSPGKSSSNANFLGNVSNLQACKNKIKEGGSFASIVFMDKTSNLSDQKWNGDCYGYSKPVPINSNNIGKSEGMYVSNIETGVKSNLKQQKTLVNRLGVLNDELHKLIDEIKSMIAKIYPKGIQNDKASVKKFEELQSRASELDIERDKIRNEKEIIESIKGQHDEGDLLLNYNKYLFGGFTIVGIGAMVFAIRAILKERRTLQ